MVSRAITLFILTACMGCGDEGPDAEFIGIEASSDMTGADTQAAHGCVSAMPYASEVIEFSPGTGAGFGQTDMPRVVLGPPQQGSPSRGSLDVLSLGVNGEIILGFGGQSVIDGPGADIVIWENAFWVDGDPDNPFAELGEVSVSDDGETWHVFPCDPDSENEFDQGCAGWRPRYEFDPCAMVPLEPEMVGGDLFDLAELGLSAVRYVRIRDMSDSGRAPSAGFDLDAVGAVHLEP